MVVRGENDIWISGWGEDYSNPIVYPAPIIFHWNGQIIDEYQVFSIQYGVEFPAMSFVSSKEGWAVIDEDVWHHSSAGWEKDTSLPCDLSDIYFPTQDEGWIVGGNFIFKYQEGIWIVADSFPFNLTAIDYNAPNDIWVVGDEILRYDGTGWAVFDSAMSGDDIEVLSLDDIWVARVDSFDLLHWNGSSWEEIDVKCYNLDFISANDGWIVGDGIWHYDHGDLSKVSPDGIWIFGVDFLNADYGAAAGDKIFIYEKKR
ncbi:MAG: hypothetical protein ABIN54_07365 [candidate division WOR-3 bacterium]